MMERSLNERFNDLEDRMISIENLTKYGTANDLKFYIFDYNPKDEILVRKEVKKIKSRNPQIVEFDLYEMMLEIIENEDYMEEVIDLEPGYDKDVLLHEIFQSLIPIQDNDNAMINMFKERINDDGNSIVLITGVGKVFPIIRSHTLLNNLHSVFRHNPLVMMYPGRYDIKEKMKLNLFERLIDDDYYRAFPLVERKKKEYDY